MFDEMKKSLCQLWVCATHHMRVFSILYDSFCSCRARSSFLLAYMCLDLPVSVVQENALCLCLTRDP